MTLLLALLGCAPAPEADSGLCEAGGPTVDHVITQLTFGRREGGTAPGFDLDGHVSDPGDDEGCGNGDLTSPEGVEGVDSAFSGLVPALEATEASAVEDLIQDSIANGQLLLILRLTDVQDPVDDPCVGAEVHRGAGTPLLGTDGRLLSHQSFAPAPDLVPAILPAAALVDGRVEARPLEMQLPLQVLDVELEFSISDGALRVVQEPDGRVHGAFAGAVPVAQILGIVAENDLGDIRDLVTSLVTLAADMHPDDEGACQSLSIVFEFEATPAFLLDP